MENIMTVHETTPHTTPHRTRLTPSLLALAAGLAMLPAAAQQTGREMGRVLSSVPVMQQVPVPRQVCNTEEVHVPGQKSGAGAVMGGIAGGAIGNQIGNGGGRAVATLIGIVGGAALGNAIEGGGEPRTQYEQRCSTQTVYETRTTAYNVTYEYAGRQYTVQMQQDPGAWVPLQVLPAPQPNSQPYNQPFNPGYGAQPYPQQYTPSYPAGEPLPPVSVVQPTTVITHETTYLGAPPVTYVRPYRSVAPVTASIWFEGGGSSGHRHRHRDDWRTHNRWDDRWR